MAVVFLGMMLISKPKDENQQKVQSEQTTDNNQQIRDITQPEIDVVIPMIKELGVADTSAASPVYNYEAENASFTVADGKLGGMVSVDSFAVVVDSVLAKSYPAGMNLNQQERAYRTLADNVRRLGTSRHFAPHMTAKASTDSVALQNDVLRIEFDNHGGYMSKATLLDKKYRTFFHAKDDKNRIDSAQVNIFKPADNAAYWVTLVNNNNNVQSCDLYFTPKQVSDSVVEMTVDFGNGAYWGYRYTLPEGDSYVVRMDIIQANMHNVFTRTIDQARFDWKMTMPRQERGLTFEERNSGIYYRYNGESPDNINGMSSKKEDLNNGLQWISFKNQFFSTVIIPRKGFISGIVKQDKLPATPEAQYVKQLGAQMQFGYNDQNEVAATFDIFIGPNLYPLLKSIDKQVPNADGLDLTRLIPLGWSWLRWINTLIIIPVFTFLSGFISNYGIIILLLTIFIKLIIFPFTYKSYLSQAKMRLLAPEIKEINDKYPGKENAMVRQQKTMALYSRAGASPFSGCLPLLLQMPILIAMFSFFPSCIELRGQSFLWVQDLAAPDVICTLPFSIPFYGNEVSLFCLLMTATNIIYTRINMKNQPSTSSMPGMKWMMYLMPLMFLFFFNSYPAALSYYYFLSLLITIIQTWVFRRCVNEGKLRRKMAENAAKPKKKSGFMARLEEAQRKQQAALREQQKRRR